MMAPAWVFIAATSRICNPEQMEKQNEYVRAISTPQLYQFVEDFRFRALGQQDTRCSPRLYAT